ncbi:MAG TPA: hypothetical protein VFV03_05970 [Solirubrobacteraceae bacterium]|nr:hypothetical protein [Solirubrobacteraceae bacterium]
MSSCRARGDRARACAARGARRPAPARRLARRGAAIIAVVGTTMVGCGGVLSPDLFVVYRSGSSPGAKLTLLVNEEGVVHCNGGPAHHLSDPQVIEARTIQEELHDPASRHESLSAAPGSVLGYYVRDQDGSVRFGDNSPGQPAVLRKLALFVLSVAQGVCGLPQQGA